MSEGERIVIIGGGLAGLSTACYARTQGFRTTIIEHNLALGGVCTAWRRGAYTIDGCIHWLTGGPFMPIYRELGIIPPVKVRPLESFLTYRDVRSGWTVSVSADLERFRAALRAVAPDDDAEIARLMEAARAFTTVDPGVDQPPELTTLRDRLTALWHLRVEAGALMHFRRPLGVWAHEQLRDERLRRLFLCMAPPEAPALVLLMMLGYLQQGWLSQPEGGTAEFRDALVEHHRGLGGEVRLNSTVEEIVVRDGHARGVRLTDGTIIEADIVVSTASGPETVLRLLGGRYGAEDMQRRLAHWKLFEPIVLLSYGVAQPYEGMPSTTIVDGIEPLRVGGVDNDHLVVRTYGDTGGFAPRGHRVVQLLLRTDYDWWATRGAEYQHEKDAVAQATLPRLEAFFPEITAAVRATDVATPISYWRSARSWRGAFEGWQPNAESLFGHVPKTLRGLADFYMAGQWVEPGGGVPTALMSGRQLTQVLCARTGRAFSAPAPA